MDGKVCVVTGATGGIGGAAAEGLARRGATVAVVARSEERGAALQARLARVAGGEAGVRLFVADLARQAEVRRLAGELAAAYPRVDVLVNVAATFSWRRVRTEDGVELQWAVNHLAPFLLTRLLLPRLRAAAAARVVTVSSGAHRWGRIDLRDPTGERRRYHGLAAYAATKLANVLFTRELARRLAGSGATANALHPGVVATELLLGGFPPLRLLRAAMRTPEEGARTVLHLAAAPELAGASGGYYEDDAPREPAPPARDDLAARGLWEWSETVTA